MNEGDAIPAPAEYFDAIVVGGGPAGATAAWDLARAGKRVALVDRAGRIKPCGGAIPPRLIEEFEIPGYMLVERITSARMVAPSDRHVDIPIENGFVGMVDREVFDEWLRLRAVQVGALYLVECFVAWEHGARFSFTVIEANLPFARAMLEDWRIVPTRQGSRVTYAIYYAPPLLLRPFVGAITRRLERDAKANLANLKQYVEAAPG